MDFIAAASCCIRASTVVRICPMYMPSLFFYFHRFFFPVGRDAKEEAEEFGLFKPAVVKIYMYTHAYIHQTRAGSPSREGRRQDKAKWKDRLAVKRR